VIRSVPILALLLVSAPADEVILADGSRLSGTVTALADTGQVMLDSQLAFEPFQVRAESLRQVVFATPGNLPDEHDAMVELTNGDQFACDLAGIDDSSVTVATTFAGEIRIPRDMIATIQLGVRPRKTIYRGPDDDSGWTVRNGWRFDSRRFTADDRGTLSRNFDIPGSFSLKFRLSWRNTPNIQVHFASDSFETSTSKANRYYLQFAGSGFELKRQQNGEGGATYLSMVTINRTPADFPDSTVEVELLVDRKLGVVHLYLDGEQEGRYSDPVKSVPTGQGIMFHSLIGGEDAQFIDRIEVRDWDASSNRHSKEERGDETRDVLITRSSDRGTVSILSMTPGADGGIVRYQGPHHPDPVDLPLSEISTMFFARAAGAEKPADPPLKLGLRGRGALGVTGCTFSGDIVAARHPLLGGLSIRRDAVASLRREEEKPQDEEPSEEDE
jgi:hypothetical protein